MYGLHIFITSHPGNGTGILAAGSATLLLSRSVGTFGDAVRDLYCPPCCPMRVLLAEKVGLHRWSAIIAGFVGTVIVIRPGFENFHLPCYWCFWPLSYLPAKRLIHASCLSLASGNVVWQLPILPAAIAHAGLVAPVQYTILSGVHLWLDSVCGYPRYYFHRRGYHYALNAAVHERAPGESLQTKMKGNESY